MKKQRGFIFLGLSVLLLLVFFATENSLGAKSMPSFALESVRDGKTVNSKTFDGKVLLLTFFATWCPPCIQEIPVLIKLQNKYSDAGFSVVALSVDQEGPEVVAKFVKKREINYPVLIAESKTAMDFGGIYGIPEAFLVNKSGNVVKKYTGYVGSTILEKDINSLLK